MIQVLLADGQPEPPFWANPIFLIAMFFLFWVVIILPMSRRQKKEQQQMLSSLKRGAKILTHSGIIGTIVTAEEGKEEITIRSEDAKFRIVRSAVSRVLGSEETEAAK